MTLDPVASDEGTAAILSVAEQGLLGPDLVFVHCFDLSDEAWVEMGAAQVAVSLSPFVDELLGWGGGGLPTVQRALDVGIHPGLSVDIETTVPTDVFTQMRALLAVQRMRGSLGKPELERPQMTARDAVATATVHGASTLGLDDVCGTLSPGKRADLIMIDCTSPNIVPMNNAFGTVALGADVHSVRAVLVSGTVRKWGDSLLGIELEEVKGRGREVTRHARRTGWLRARCVRRLPLGRLRYAHAPRLTSGIFLAPGPSTVPAAATNAA